MRYAIANGFSLIKFEIILIQKDKKDDLQSYEDRLKCVERFTENPVVDQVYYLGLIQSFPLVHWLIGGQLQ